LGGSIIFPLKNAMSKAKRVFKYQRKVRLPIRNLNDKNNSYMKKQEKKEKCWVSGLLRLKDTAWLKDTALNLSIYLNEDITIATKLKAIRFNRSVCSIKTNIQNVRDYKLS